MKKNSASISSWIDLSTEEFIDYCLDNVDTVVSDSGIYQIEYTLDDLVQIFDNLKTIKT